MRSAKQTKKTAAKFRRVPVYFYDREVLERVQRACKVSGISSLSPWIVQAAIEKANRDLGNAC